MESQLLEDEVKLSPYTIVLTDHPRNYDVSVPSLSWRLCFILDSLPELSSLQKTGDKLAKQSKLGFVAEEAKPPS